MRPRTEEFTESEIKKIALLLSDSNLSIRKIARIKQVDVARICHINQKYRIRVARTTDVKPPKNR